MRGDLDDYIINFTGEYVGGSQGHIFIFIEGDSRNLIGR